MGAGNVAVARCWRARTPGVGPDMDERTWRLCLGSEVRACAAGQGCGMAAAVAVVAGAAGVSRATVMGGAGELAGGAGPMPGRARRPGAGREKAEEARPGFGEALRELVGEATRGDPVAEVTWCSLSLRDLERRMAGRGFRCRKDAVARMMREDGSGLQGMARVLAGRQHPGRDARFGQINAMIAGFRAAGDPVVWADAKKEEELAGRYGRAGPAVAAPGRAGQGPRPRLPR
jgi:Rhodopirellula transposase DDE domain